MATNTSIPTWSAMVEELERIEALADKELQRLQLAAVMLANSGGLPDVANAARNLIRQTACNLDGMTAAVSSAAQVMAKTAGTPV